MAKGAYIDYGMFLQSVALAARSIGLHTCARASIAEYPEVLRSELRLSDEDMPLCGMSLGHADPNADVNHFQPHREPVSAFTCFHE
jgi:nitroreductase